MDTRHKDMAYICVFCGSNEKAAWRYAKEAVKLADYIAENGFGLVFGGTHTGLMRLMADKMRGRGLKVIGVITPDMDTMRINYPGIELVMKPNLEERKKEMMALSVGCISLPGGFGTFDELNWLNVINQLNSLAGKEIKPHAIFNIDNYYGGLIDQIDRGVQDGFIDEKYAKTIYFSNHPQELLYHIMHFRQPKSDKSQWWEERDMPNIGCAFLLKQDNVECQLQQSAYSLSENKRVSGKVKYS